MAALGGRVFSIDEIAARARATDRLRESSSRVLSIDGRH
jgi:hypothetical protein